MPIKVKFLADTVHETLGRGQGPRYEAGKEYELADDQAQRWITRRLAVRAEEQEPDPRYGGAKLVGVPVGDAPAARPAVAAGDPTAQGAHAPPPAPVAAKSPQPNYPSPYRPEPPAVVTAEVEALVEKAQEQRAQAEPSPAEEKPAPEGEPSEEEKSSPRRRAR